MSYSTLLPLLLVLFLVKLCHAQDGPTNRAADHPTGRQLPTDRHMATAYQKATRSTMGSPGAEYWQNEANYQIDITFEPASRRLSGMVHIDYMNNSPDTLSTLLFKLYANLYKADAMRNNIIAPEDVSDGIHISAMSIDGRAIDATQRRTTGTNMSVKGVTLLPHARTSVDITYAYTLNKGSFIRTGQIDPGSYFIAYFFPRITVYDDVDGWNDHPYLGKEEFYNDYGDFDVSITVPGNFCVWATGDLMNTADVYQPEFVKRIAQAESHDSTVDIITTADISNGHITQANPTNTWRFNAKQVTDFAFAISGNYIWKSSSLVVDAKTGRRTRVDAVYHPSHHTYAPVVDYNRKTVALISYSFPAIPFPYSHSTIVDGLDAMEYPMMVNNLPFEEAKDVVEFTAHEVFHTIFPFYVGTNETKYSFMDEGWATMAEFMFHPQLAPNVSLHYDLSPINDYAGMAEDMPIMTPTPQLYGKARYADKDLKPALALYYLKGMLGDDVFVSALQHYINTWAGKHPTPYDFFHCMNAAAGIDLTWYWKKWWFEKAVPDLAISQVSAHSKHYKITIRNIGGAPVPVHLTILFNDGTTQTITETVTAWKTGKTEVVVSVPRAKRHIAKITLGDAYDADTNPSDNVWVATR